MRTPSLRPDHISLLLNMQLLAQVPDPPAPPLAIFLHKYPKSVLSSTIPCASSYCPNEGCCIGGRLLHTAVDMHALSLPTPTECRTEILVMVCTKINRANCWQVYYHDLSCLLIHTRLVIRLCVCARGNVLCVIDGGWYCAGGGKGWVM